MNKNKRFNFYYDLPKNVWVVTDNTFPNHLWEFPNNKGPLPNYFSRVLAGNEPEPNNVTYHHILGNPNNIYSGKKVRRFVEEEIDE